jgi:hypothetical protein
MSVASPRAPSGSQGLPLGLYPWFRLSQLWGDSLFSLVLHSDREIVCVTLPNVKLRHVRDIPQINKYFPERNGLLTTSRRERLNALLIYDRLIKPLFPESEHQAGLQELDSAITILIGISCKLIVR